MKRTAQLALTSLCVDKVLTLWRKSVLTVQQIHSEPPLKIRAFVAVQIVHHKSIMASMKSSVSISKLERLRSICGPNRLTNRWPHTTASPILSHCSIPGQAFYLSIFVAAKTLDASHSHDDYMHMQFCNLKCYATKHIADVSLIDAKDAAQTQFIFSMQFQRAAKALWLI